MMKKLLALLLVVVMVLSFAACSTTPSGEVDGEDPMADMTWDEIVAAAKEEGEVIVYSNFPEAIEVEILSAFEEEYGIDVVYTKIGGSIPTMNKYLTEAENGQSVVDLIQMSSVTAITIGERGYSKAIPDYLPNLVNLSPDYQPEEFFLPTVIEAIVCVYNTEMVSPDELPDTYEDLADPKYTGQVIMGSPENSANTVKFIQGTKELYGEDFISKLQAIDIMEVDKEVTAADLVGKGERPWAFMSQNAASTAIGAGAPLSFKAMEQTFTGVNGIVLPYKAPNPHASLVLANWMIGETHQNLFVDNLRAIGATTVARAPEGIPALEDLGSYTPDPDIVANNSADLINEWRQAMDAK